MPQAPDSAMPPAATLSIDESHAEPLSLTIRGRLDLNGASALWQPAVKLIDQRQPQRVNLNLAEVDYCDGIGIGLVVELERRTSLHGGDFKVQGLAEKYSKLREQFDPDLLRELPSTRPEPCCLPEATGLAVVKTWRALKALISFTGELTVALLAALKRPHTVRWRDVWLTVEKAGVDALPLVVLLSFLVGLIMAFQAAIPMRQFGTEIYVANLIGLATLRELGPLMTAIILAGRSASAFAAELGTMKVNEEIDALTTMGLAPVPFLVVTRVLAALFVTPLLTLFANLFGLAGGSVVLLSLDYPLITYIQQVQSAVSFGDCLGGLAKSLVFGIIIAAMGCLQGLRAGTGASAVGDAATRAVVSGIVLIVIGDGVFSVLYYYLGI